eukprot:12212338-Alexandrium_andersonii.AAC.1
MCCASEARRLMRRVRCAPAADSLIGNRQAFALRFCPHQFRTFAARHRCWSGAGEGGVVCMR